MRLMNQNPIRVFMTMASKHFTIVEYEKLMTQDFGDKKGFYELRDFAFSETGQKVLSAGMDYVKAKSHVGVIQTKSGHTVEILPKIYLTKEKEDVSHEIKETYRQIFCQMLKKIKRLPDNKKLDFARLRTDKNIPILEVYISMFADEMFSLIQKGVLAFYVTKEANLKYLKGKLKINDHIKHNYIHKERFFVAYDEFLPDIPENRLLKSTIIKLEKLSRSLENQKKLKELRFVMDDIPLSRQIKQDFARCRKDRSVKHYEKALAWSRLFLNEESFSSYRGPGIAFAILFPMEKVFEAYVGELLRERQDIRDFRTQDKRYYLAKENGKDIFQLRPDFTGLIDNKLYIMDAKWKLINEKSRDEKYGINQSDMYQLFSYGKIYENIGNNNEKDKKTIQLELFYPEPQGASGSTIEFCFNDRNKISLKVCFVNLEDGKINWSHDGNE